MQRKKPTYLQQRKPKDEINKKLLIWVGCVFAAIIIAMTVLLLLNK
ncbi:MULTISPECIES: hypothetical protein [Paenibacillus]|uniref:DUF4044 domain-containing protein n=1 Tax=Paenibacillus radicis (ex Xue et al. 2023) TaxID=2972489 RepID=A0ABT1YD48_9BACL|nr:hypothetical protein [Paenibacillus radicis (ex Xue et al. 2023)]MCR8631126.1 hypothetical protein [Paenibacillus radicis (ex Xue et al. 2023)]